MTLPAAASVADVKAGLADAAPPAGGAWGSHSARVPRQVCVCVCVWVCVGVCVCVCVQDEHEDGVGRSYGDVTAPARGRAGAGDRGELSAAQRRAAAARRARVRRGARRSLCVLRLPRRRAPN